MFVGFAVIEILLFNRRTKKDTALQQEDEKNGSRRKTWQLCESLNYQYYTGYTGPVLQAFFADIASFQHVLDFDVGRSQIKWSLK